VFEKDLGPKLAGLRGCFSRDDWFQLEMVQTGETLVASSRDVVLVLGHADSASLQQKEN